MSMCWYLKSRRLRRRCILNPCKRCFSLLNNSRSSPRVTYIPTPLATFFLKWAVQAIAITFLDNIASAVQQSFVDLLTNIIFTFRLVVSMFTSSFISIEWSFRPYKPYILWKLIIWWWQWPRRRLTKRQIQRQRHPETDKDRYKVLQRPNICYIFRKQGVQGFKILYWLSSCDDTEKDKNPILCIIRGEYFSGVNIFHG